MFLDKLEEKLTFFILFVEEIHIKLKRLYRQKIVCLPCQTEKLP